jgi:hypothetical protein
VPRTLSGHVPCQNKEYNPSLLYLYLILNKKGLKSPPLMAFGEKKTLSKTLETILSI